MFKPTLNLKPKKIATTFLKASAFCLIIFSLLLSSAPQTAQAAVDKLITSGAGPYRPGDTVNLEIRVPRPTSINVAPFEVVFVVDASASMSTEIENIKLPMRNFIESLSTLPGAVQVGIISFGNNPDKFDTDSNDWFPITHANLTTVSTEANRTSLKNAINAIKGSSGPAYSDLQRALQMGNNMFGNDASGGRFLVSLTDGLHNFPAPNSYVYSTYSGWVGKCAFTGGQTPGSLNLTNQKLTNLVMIPGGADLNKLIDFSFNEMPTRRYISPCGYPQSSSRPTGAEFIDHVVTAGTNSGKTSNKAADMSAAVAIIRNTITPTTVTLTDQLDPAVFGNGSITSAGDVYNCATNAPAAGGNNWVSGSGDTINSNFTYNPAIAEYCVRFTARVGGGATAGTKSINTVVNPDTRVKYFNKYGDVIATDGIKPGSITIANNPDMDLSQFWLTNSTGVEKKVFNTGEQVYLHTQIRNTGDSTMPADFKTAFYKNRASTAPVNTNSDIPMYIIGHGALGAGSSRSYDSRPGGSFPSTSSPSTNTGNPRSWSYATAGNYTARAFTNFTNVGSESGANNQATYGYSVITPPSNLQTNNLLCHQTTLTWNAGSSNITGYDVEVIDTALYLSSILSGTPYNDYVAYNHSIPPTPSSLTATNLQPSKLYSFVLRPKVGANSGSSVSMSFTTPACPDYTTDIGGPYALNPGQTSDTIANVNISYLPNTQSWVNHSANLVVSVVGINYNNDSCAAYSANGAPFTGNRDGLTARISGNPSQASRTVTAPTNPVSFTIQSTTATNTGRYTICIGTYSPNSFITRAEVKPIYINVELQPWVQIDRPASSGASMVGDVHSNASINFSIPLNQYFFKDGTAGVISSTGSISNIPNNRLTDIASKLWRIPSYSQQVKTEAYDNLVALAVSSLDDPADGLPSGLPSTANITAHCATGGGVFHYKPTTGTLTRNSVINLSSQACAGKNLVYFIDGNLTHGANIIDDTTNATITFIVKGNVSVSPSVTQLDGVHIFGGNFRDGSIYNTSTGAKDQPLVINGSLIGLASQSPVSTKGTFSQSTYSGLQRNLSFGASGNDTVPAERIVYQPKYLFLLREILGTSSFTWNE